MKGLCLLYPQIFDMAAGNEECVLAMSDGQLVENECESAAPLSMLPIRFHNPAKEESSRSVGPRSNH